MRKYIYLIISFLSVTLFFNSCKETDLTPVYLHITKETLADCIDVSNYNEMHNENYDQEHLDALKRHKFTHVTVYVNNKNLGCWELPCKVPVLGVNSTDTSTLVLLPAFPMTGMANTIWGYPFLNICRQKVVLQKGTTYEADQNPPKYIYSEYTRIPFFHTFSNSTPFTPSDTSRSKLNLLPTAYDGKNVGALTMSDSTGLSFDILSSSFAVPVGHARVILEITYKTDCDVDVAMKMSTASNPHMAYSLGGFYASPNEWKTIHFDMSTMIQNYYASSGSVTDATLVLSGAGEKGKVSNVYIDDIKVLYIRTA
jgi:hypothetical protein